MFLARPPQRSVNVSGLIGRGSIGNTCARVGWAALGALGVLPVVVAAAAAERPGMEDKLSYHLHKIRAVVHWLDRISLEAVIEMPRNHDLLSSSREWQGRRHSKAVHLEVIKGSSLTLSPRAMELLAISGLVTRWAVYLCYWRLSVSHILLQVIWPSDCHAVGPSALANHFTAASSSSLGCETTLYHLRLFVLCGRGPHGFGCQQLQLF